MYFEYADNAPHLKTVTFEGNKLILEREDPYGFWYLRLERGNLPEWMKGSYTSADAAKKDITKYLSIKKKNVVAING